MVNMKTFKRLTANITSPTAGNQHIFDLLFGASSTIQGNAFYCNFISKCTNSLYFNGPAATTPAWNGNYWEVQAINAFNVANSRGIYAPNGAMLLVRFT